jgi:long-chain acyl-CoA synthetase
VLVLAPGADTQAIVRGANAHLEDHQRVWSTSMWPGDSLPRTEGTQKLKRRQIQQWAAGETPAASAITGTSLIDIVGRYTAGRALTPETTLDELGLSSLDRVELMMALEEAFHTTLDESSLTGPRTLGELETRLKSDEVTTSSSAASNAPATRASATPRPADQPIAFPSWNRSWLSWLIRRISLPTWILPLGRLFMQMDVRGLEHLRDLRTPVIFAANHQSHMDTPAILIALPARWRYRVAPAMAKEFFKAHFNPQAFSRRAWFTNSLNYYLACQFFNAFPLPQREAGTRQTLRYIGEVLADGYSVLIFPEGRRSDEGVGRFMPGIGMIASKLDVQVVPVRIDGLENVLHPKMRFPKRGPVRVAFGAPMRLNGDDYPALARQVEDAVKGLSG